MRADWEHLQRSRKKGRGSYQRTWNNHHWNSWQSKIWLGCNDVCRTFGSFNWIWRIVFGRCLWSRSAWWLSEKGNQFNANPHTLEQSRLTHRDACHCSNAVCAPGRFSCWKIEYHNRSNIDRFDAPASVAATANQIENSEYSVRNRKNSVLLLDQNNHHHWK